MATVRPTAGTTPRSSRGEPARLLLPAAPAYITALTGVTTLSLDRKPARAGAVSRRPRRSTTPASRNEIEGVDVYLLWHMRPREGQEDIDPGLNHTEAEDKLSGAYSTEDRAREAQLRLVLQPGSKDHSNHFHVAAHQSTSCSGPRAHHGLTNSGLDHPDVAYRDAWTDWSVASPSGSRDPCRVMLHGVDGRHTVHQSAITGRQEE
jgi:hypothetical protein